MSEPNLCAVSKLLDDFDAPDATGKFGKNSCLIAKPGPDLEDDVLRFQGQKIRHQRADEGLGYGLFEANRQRPVLIRQVGKRLRHEQMPWNARHRSQDALIEGDLAKLLFEQIGVDPNDVDHVSTQYRQMLVGHRLHAVGPWFLYRPGCASR